MNQAWCRECSYTEKDSPPLPLYANCIIIVGAMKCIACLLVLILVGCRTLPPEDLEQATRRISCDLNGDDIPDSVDLYHVQTKGENGYPSIAIASITRNGAKVPIMMREHSGRFPSMMSIVTRDLDGDGSDELVVATYSAGITHTYMTVCILQYAAPKNKFATLKTTHFEDKSINDIDLSKL